MKYYLLYSLTLLCCNFSTAQQDTNSQIIKPKADNLRFMLIEVGTYTAVPINNSFISESDSNLGFDINSSLIISDTYIIGLGYNQFKLKNHDYSRTGFFEQTRTTAFYLQLGYKHRFKEKWAATASYGIGQAIYTHELFDSTENFTDKGMYNHLSMKLHYSISKNIDLNAHVGYRIDFLDTDVPPQLSKLYDNVSYLTTGLSISIFLEKNN